MDNSFKNWAQCINSQLEFYARAPKRRRRDAELDWNWYYARRGWKEKLYPYARPWLNLLHGRPMKSFMVHTQEWFNQNAEILWQTRQNLADGLSQVLFDSYLLLVVLDFEKYYFPRSDFEPLVTIQSESEFTGDLPKDYLDSPLKVFCLKLNNEAAVPEIRIVSTQMQIDLLNNYRQYFVKRGQVSFMPSSGDVVLDCGACIGDISAIFAGLVGDSGQVHLFDPVPLHNRYCGLQEALNPALKGVLKANELAVGEASSESEGKIKDINSISPGGLAVDNFKTTSIDDYVDKHRLPRVDYIKMDIEGFETDALNGAAGTIRKFKPKLAISAYHRDYDLWKLPALILKLNPEYRIYFGHHSPKSWEAVYYAA